MLWLDSWALAGEASSVVSLRAKKLARGDHAAACELRLLLSEKGQSWFELQRMMLAGQFAYDPTRTAQMIVSHYRRKVRANLRRLARAS